MREYICCGSCAVKVFILNKLMSYLMLQWCHKYSMHCLCGLPISQLHKNGRTDDILKRTYKFGFCKELLHIRVLLERSAIKLFKCVQNPDHCLNQLLPPIRPGGINTNCLSADVIHTRIHSVNWCLFALL